MTSRTLGLPTLLAVCMSATACTVPAPSPPAQGAYGRVADDFTDYSEAIVGQAIYAAPPSLTEGMSSADLPIAITDGDGNFTFEIAAGRVRLCLGESGSLQHCDCIIEVAPAGKVHRDYNRTGQPPYPWSGDWYQAGGAASDACVDYP